jgi:DNA polymerase III subunit alpha
MNSEELIWQWLRFGWNYRKIGQRSPTERQWYADRTRYEMGLITGKDYVDFFLATSEMVRWAKDYRGPEAPHGIPMGPGRGSVAASVVSWLLRITEVDPIRYPHLLFERFIDVTRTDPPDIDLDISDEHRYLVRDHMADKYGADCVGTVANFVRYRGKNSLDDTCRVYQIPHWAKKAVSERIIERSGGDSRFSSSLQDTFDMFPSAMAIKEQFPKVWQATRLEGNVRGMSIHAAGLIVSNTPLTDVCSVYDRDGRSVLSIDKYDVEYANMIKMDLLGLSTMGIIANCLEMAGLTLEDLYAIPDDDTGALEIFKRGDVTGVFQFEGRATRLVNRDVSPDNFAEVVDINALSRPGPLFSGTTAEYCDVKHGRRKPEHFHPITDQITAHTRGQIIYQEQILQIVREVGGFDWTNANEIRRIIAKKIGEAAFNVSMGNFVEGAARLHNIDEKTAQRIWKRLVTSGTYAFVYAHSVSYSILGLWCAWLKAHYPLEFYAASLAKEGDEEGRFRLMKDALAHGIDIRPPSLAHSRRSWIGLPGAGLVAGWEQIKGIGEKTGERIEEYKPEGGWKNWADLQIIPGIGPKTVEKMEEFATARDPFGLLRTEETLAKTRDWLEKEHRFMRRSIPIPTHNGTETAALYVEQNYGANAKSNYGKGPRVVYMGLVREINYQDAVENRRSRTGEEAADILKTLKRPDLLAYCSVRCYDTTDEEVYLRVNRFKFPALKRILESIAVNHDVVVCVGSRIAGFGTPVMVDRLYVIDPD